MGQRQSRCDYSQEGSPSGWICYSNSEGGSSSNGFLSYIQSKQANRDADDWNSPHISHKLIDNGDAGTTGVRTQRWRDRRRRQIRPGAVPPSGC